MRVPNTHTPPACLLGLGTIALALGSLNGFESLGRNFAWTASLTLVAFCGFLLCVRELVLGRWRPGFGTALALVVGLRLLTLPLAPTLSDDIYRYVWEGRLGLAGENPYLFAPNDPELSALRDPVIWPRINHPEIPAAYPPFLQATLQLGVRVGRVLGDEVLGQKLVFGSADVLVFVLLWQSLSRARRRPELALVQGLAPLAILEFAGMGHSDSLTVACTLAALWANRCRRGALAGGLLAVATATKYLPLGLLPFVVRRNGSRAGLSFVAALALLYAPFVPIDDPALVFEGTRAYADLVPTGGSAFPALLAGLETLADRERARQVTTVVFAVIGLSLFACGWARRVSAERFAVWIGLYFLFASPTVHPWYVAAFLLPCCVVLPSFILLATSATAIFSYHLLPGWLDRGVWEQSVWWRALVWAPFWIGLAVVGSRRNSRRRGSVPQSLPVLEVVDIENRI